MATYEFDRMAVWTEEWNLSILQAKIKGAMFDAGHDVSWYLGMSCASGYFSIETTRDLTTSEYNALSNAMNTKDGLKPSTAGWTLVTIPDFVRDWRTIESTGGIKIDYAFVNDVTGNIELWTYGDLTTQKKNAVKNALAALISIIKY